MKKNIIIIGCGGHAKSVIEIIESTNKWNIIGLIGLENELNKKVLDYKVIGTDKDLKEIRESYSNCINAIGQIKDSQKRLLVSEKLKHLKFETPTISASSSIVSKSALIKSGVTIGHGAVINANAIIGENCIVNTNAVIEHDAKIGDFCHISTGVLINGGASIGAHSFIGSGAIIRENIEIPSNTILGAGKIILHWPVTLI